MPDELNYIIRIMVSVFFTGLILEFILFGTDYQFFNQFISEMGKEYYGNTGQDNPFRLLFLGIVFCQVVFLLFILISPKESWQNPSLMNVILFILVFSWAFVMFPMDTEPYLHSVGAHLITFFASVFAIYLLLVNRPKLYKWYLIIYGLIIVIYLWELNQAIYTAHMQKITFFYIFALIFFGTFPEQQKEKK